MHIHYAVFCYADFDVNQLINLYFNFIYHYSAEVTVEDINY